jgi:hypothetical protein
MARPFSANDVALFKSHVVPIWARVGLRERDARAHARGSWRMAHGPCMQDVPASVDGVLGGFGTVTDVDIKESDEFLTHLQDRKLLSIEPSSRAADCGAGILMITDTLIGCTCVKSSGCTDVFSPCMGAFAWALHRDRSHQRRHAMQAFLECGPR